VFLPASYRDRRAAISIAERGQIRVRAEFTEESMATTRKTPAKPVQKIKVKDLKAGARTIKGGAYAKNVKI
jgi:hypothetical protein